MDTDFEFFRVCQNEIVVKELSVAAANVSEIFCFKSPYVIASPGTNENGLIWEDVHIAYHELYTVARDALARFAHLYACGVSKCKFLTEYLWRSILNLQDFNCPLPTSSNHKYWCSMSCHKFPNINCSTITTHSLYDWLIYHLQAKYYVKCPKDMTRHTAKFVSAI